MLQRIHNILAWITINTKTEASIWALKLQTKLTNRYPHLNKPRGLHFSASLYADWVKEMDMPLDEDGCFIAYKKVN